MLITTDLTKSSESRLTPDLKKMAEQLRERHRERSLTTEQKDRRFRQLLSETGDPERARKALERIVGGNDLVEINYLAKGTLAARSVGRIQLCLSSGEVIGYGTGFLVGPGVLMTNNHVLPRNADARYSIVDFDYELDVNGRERPVVHFALDPQSLFYTNEELDFTVVAVSPQSTEGGRDLASYGWLPLSAEPGKADEGEYLSPIQHPGGDHKQVCVRENRLLKYMEQTVWYLADTLAGSSGSPVFNRFWQVVALHHSGVPRKDSSGNWLTKDNKVWDDSMDESSVDWIANEGIRVSAIVRHLREKQGSLPFIKELLDSPAPTSPFQQLRYSTNGQNGQNRNGHSNIDALVELDGDSAALVVPLRIPVELVHKGLASVRMPATPKTPATPRPEAGTQSAGTLVEKVVIDQSKINTWPGYRADFLGIGKLSVPLPKIPSQLKSQVAMLLKKPSESELKYFNYSAVVNKSRRLAFFSAVNIDGKLRRDVGKREGDKWFRDPRLSSDFQLGEEFYKRQNLGEAREDNPFDRGHLVRRLDATWGSTEAEAKTHGDTTFHFTNCAPQFYAFNQGKKLWLGIEDYVLNQLETNKRKACVINGPVFDGPLVTGNDLPDPNASRKPDPKFKGVPIPKFFWKIMVVENAGKLEASAFLLSQQEQILAINRIEELTDAQARVFQISIADLAKLTKLDFGKLTHADTKEAARKAKPRLIESLEDIRRP